MQVFRCECNATLFFENTRCLNCSRELGYLPDLGQMAALVPDEKGGIRACLRGGIPYGARRKCRNYTEYNVCNWMVGEDDPNPLCLACRLNDTIPNLEQPQNLTYWAKIEAAKRRLVYSLLRFGLPVRSKTEDGEGGLAFAFLANPKPGEGDGSPPAPVLTGHDDGLITINIAEADEIEREQVRMQMAEAYRTLLGHFRHESGHYYWDRLVRGSRHEERCRAIFGDEREDYAEALQRHYAKGARTGWETHFISVYAGSHPWEDWAETWAHYLHITDTLETSRAFGIEAHPEAIEIIDQHLLEVVAEEQKAPDEAAEARAGAEGDGSAQGSEGPRGLQHAQGEGAAPFTQLLRDWIWLSLGMNSINRSMGMRDVYPFVLSETIVRKLRFVHDIVAEAGASLVSPAYAASVDAPTSGSPQRGEDVAEPPARTAPAGIELKPLPVT